MIKTNDFRIKQRFDDVLTSDKGVVKLIKNDGSDFIFNANLIKEIGQCEKYRDSTNLYNILSSIFNDDTDIIYTYIKLGVNIKIKVIFLYIKIMNMQIQNYPLHIKNRVKLMN